VIIKREPLCDESRKLILDGHYLHRLPSISYCYKMFDDIGSICGVCTFGTPPSPPLRRGVCGDEYKGNVIELNRLFLTNNLKNQASKIVGFSLRDLSKVGNFIVVSFADTSANHIGYVYQACNFTYTGLSAKRTDWSVEGLDLHGVSIADKFRNKSGKRSDLVREEYGDKFSLKERSRKHRYVYFTGSKTFKISAMKSLKYKVEPYPKG
jgi:hypothetical protein